MTPDPQVLAKAEKYLTKGIAALLFTEPFYATLMLQLQRVPVGPEVTEVAAVDGKHLFYNPEAILKLTFDELRFLIIHEVQHLAMQHHVRMIGKDPKLSNIAADHCDNLILQEAGYTLIKGSLCDPQYKGQTFEQVYAKISQQPKGGGGGQQQPPQQQKQQPQQGGGAGQKNPPGGQKPGQQPGAGQGKPQPGNQPGQPGQPGQQPGQGGGQPQPQAAQTPGGFGQIIPCPKDEQASQEAEWKLAVEQAATAATAAGKMPGHLKRLVEELRRSRVDWRDLLKSFIAEQVPKDFTWSRPSKRFLSQDLYLPSQKKEGLAELVFVIDASGSIGGPQLGEFKGEIAVVHQEMKPSRLTVLSHDTRCHHLGDFSSGDDVDYVVKGGGGTDFRCIFDWIAQDDRKPKAVVVLTDLMGSFPAPGQEPDYPVLWIATNQRIAPFGETAFMQ